MTILMKTPMIFKPKSMKIRKFCNKTDSEKTPIIMKFHIKELLQFLNKYGKGERKFNLYFKNEQSSIKAIQYKINTFPKEKKRSKKK